jgi:hypothetical protein
MRVYTKHTAYNWDNFVISDESIMAPIELQGLCDVAFLPRKYLKICAVWA